MVTVSNSMLSLVSVDDEEKLNSLTDKGYTPLSCTDKVVCLMLTPESILNQIKLNINHGIKTEITILNVAHCVNEKELAKDKDRKILVQFLDKHEKRSGVRLSTAKILGNIVTIEILDEIFLDNFIKEITNIDKVEVLMLKDIITCRTNERVLIVKGKDETNQMPYKIKILGVLSNN